MVDRKHEARRYLVLAIEHLDEDNIEKAYTKVRRADMELTAAFIDEVSEEYE